MRKALIILIVLFGSFLIMGCTENKPVTPNETGTPEKAVTSAEVVTPTGEKATEVQTATEIQTATETQNVTETTGMQEYTLEELAQYNGENGKTYVAYQGQVYDISNNNVWRSGVHNGCKAGTDLTDKMDKAPHRANILKDYPVVGTLKK